MVAIGIDIVDLLQARKESNWQRSGFLEKLFNTEERELIQQANDPERMVWLLWTMKESAYKIYSREFQWHAFAPGQLSCSLLSISSDCATGQVSCRNENYHTQTILSRDLIHTIAFSDTGTHDNRGIDHDGAACDDSSADKNTGLAKDIQTAAGMAKKVRVLILKNQDESKSYRKTKPATVSHHGRYLALAYL
ncbi:hypothetical protein PBAL39_25180 [Pedobacter sp. BAL39]|nr:hypothetical protein PBAL39_25180 [Pedobacter sp. BAL39]